MITQEKKLSVTNLLMSTTTGQNPLALSPAEGWLENGFARNRKIVRRMASPTFTNQGAASTGVWKIYQFNFVRDSAPETQLLIFRNNGRIYKVEGGDELEVFPGYTTFSILSSKPAVVSIADRLHVSDGSQYLIWDGWDWFKAGLEPSASAPSTALVAGSLTGSYKIAVTAVHIRNGVRIHESNRSPITSFIAPSTQNIRVTKPSDLPARATHWSVYISEVSTSDILRRSVTVPITTTTTDISAEPAGTSPLAPERNDPVQPSKVLAQWKNRIAMRNEQQPDQLWFTAFQEVKGRLNGAPEECLPGRSSTSISDLVNSWTLPDRGERIQAAVWHENFLFVFSERNGYVVQGEGGLLDSRGLRDFFPIHQFPFGCAGPSAAISTPHGLVVLSPEKQLWLWSGGEDVTNLGTYIQGALDRISSDDLVAAELEYYNGNDKDWLLLGIVDNDFGGLVVLDLKLITLNQVGAWGLHSLAQLTAAMRPSALGLFRETSKTFLLVGNTFATGPVSSVDGEVYLFDVEAQPAYLETDGTAACGMSYLGTSPLSSPVFRVMTPATFLESRQWMEVKYLEWIQIAYAPVANWLGGGQKFTLIYNNNTQGASVAVTGYYDIRKFAPLPTHSAIAGGDVRIAAISSVALPVVQLGQDKSFRAWAGLSGGSKTGVLLKSFAAQFSWTSTATTTIASANTVALNEEILSLGLAWQERSDLMQ